MKAEVEFPKTFIDAAAYFADQDAAHAFMCHLRWPDGVQCVHCNCHSVGYISTRRKFKCKGCGKQFSVKVGTIFEDSPIPLGKWLCAVWLEANAKNSVSSYEVHRSLGVTQKTAWFMQQRIRLAMQTGTFNKLRGHAEVDETFIGGKARIMHKGRRKAGGRGAAGKAVVMGLLERHGEVRTLVVDNTKGKTVRPLVHEHVEKGSNVFTDALASYNSLAPEYVHQVIDQVLREGQRPHERAGELLEPIHAVHQRDARFGRTVPPVPVSGRGDVPVQ